MLNGGLNSGSGKRPILDVIGRAESFQSADVLFPALSASIICPPQVLGHA
jgi:hypothetical protein